MMDALSRGVELAKVRHDLHAEINDLTENDAVLLVIGQRWVEDGKEKSYVRTVPLNVHDFELMGMIEVARLRYGTAYKSE